MIVRRQETETSRLVLIVVFAGLSGLTGCSFFSKGNSDTARQETASKPAADQQYSSNPQNFRTLTADQWLNLSRSYHQQGKYLEAIAAAQTALYLKPDFAEAYNNIGAAYASLGIWEPAIQAAQQALRLKPDFPLARNNLAWALQQKQRESP
ncbi:MAG TPA: tetratricopeptide repeat protein [Terriglobia bacterium]|nr:tetratricopeptide repeat protein [Terriglobia bacterium]